MNIKYFLMFLFCLTVFETYSQTGIGTKTPHKSAALDITSTTKGLLIPRMTRVQRNAIPNPAEGLEVFATNTQTKYYFNGTTWEESFQDNYNAYYQIYSFIYSNSTGNNTLPINMTTVQQVFNSVDATYAEIGGTNSIRILENGLYALELTGSIFRSGANPDPVTCRYILRKNGVDLGYCFESLGQAYNGNNATSVGVTFPPFNFQNGDLLTMWIQNVDGSAVGMSFYFIGTTLSVTKINSN